MELSTSRRVGHSSVAKHQAHTLLLPHQRYLTTLASDDKYPSDPSESRLWSGVRLRPTHVLQPMALLRRGVAIIRIKCRSTICTYDTRRFPVWVHGSFFIFRPFVICPQNLHRFNQIPVCTSTDRLLKAFCCRLPGREAARANITRNSKRDVACTRTGLVFMALQLAPWAPSQNRSCACCC